MIRNRKGDLLNRSSRSYKCLIVPQVGIRISRASTINEPRLGRHVLTNAGKPIYTAFDVWKSQFGTTIPTGFLMSSAMRLQESSFSWAPESPYAAPESDDAQSSRDCYRASTVWALNGHRSRKRAFSVNGGFAHSIYRTSKPRLRIPS